MDGLELTTRNATRPEETRDIETLLNTMSNAGSDISDGALQQICNFLEKVCRFFQEVDHELLQRIFKCLQTWSLTSALSRLLQIGIVQILARIYDNLMESDYSRSDVFESILELLFIVEDMSDSIEGKIQCGKIFLSRLLALAATKLPSVKLHRAAAETICALVTKSPDNQQAVLDDMADCHKLFKILLPKCGDFQLQASITEIFYRLAKRGPQLLQFVQDKIVRRSMVSLVQSKKPDLLSEIRSIVMLLNESLGPLRSVYSFVAEQIVIDGHKMITNEKWVNFGRAQLSFYILPGIADPDSEGPSMMDVQYDDIMELKRSSVTLLEISVQEKPGIFSFNKAPGMGSGTLTSKLIKIQMYFTPRDLSEIEAIVSTKLRTQPVRQQVVRGLNVIGHSETGDKSTSKSSKSGFGFYKSSTGISHALPRKQDTPNSQAGGQALQRSVEAGVEVVSSTLQPNFDRNCKTSRKNNIHLHSEIWSRGSQLPKRAGKSSSEYIHSASEFVLETPHDRETHEGVSTAPDKDLTSKGQRNAEPSQLHVGTQQKLADLKMKSQSAAMICARVTDSHDQAVDHELRTKQRQDSQQIHLMESEVPNVGVKLVRNAGYRTKDAGFDEVKLQSPVSSDKILITPPRDMSNGRKKPASSNRGAKRYYVRKSLEVVQDCNTVPAEVGAKNVSRTLKTRDCKKSSLNYSEWDSDDEFSSGASEGSGEFEGRGQKRSKVTDISDLVVKSTNSAEQRTVQIVAKCKTRLTATQPENRIRAASCEKTDVMLDQVHLDRRDNKAATISVGGQKNCSGKTQAAHEQKFACALTSKKEIPGNDVFCFTAGLVPGSSKASVELNCKVGRDLSHGGASPKRRKTTALKFCNQLRNARQESCTSDRPRSATPDASPAQIINLSSSPSQKQQDDMQTPRRQHNAGRGVPCESDDLSRSPDLQNLVQKTCIKLDNVITKRSKMERWKSFNISKLELPKVDTASTEESSDKLTVDSSPRLPHATILELEDAALDCEAGSGIGMIASLLRSFKRKVKFEEKKMVEDILSNTMQRIQNEIRWAEKQVQGQKTEFGEVCKRKCETINNHAQGQTRKMRVIYEKFQQDFAAHLQQHEKIVAGIEETETEIHDLAKQQAQAQQVVLAQLQRLCKRHLAEADKKILEVEKSSKGMHGLKDAVRGVLDL